MNKIIILLFAILLTAGVQIAAAGSSRSDDKDTAAIKKELAATAEGWNNGDLKKYLAAYVPGAKGPVFMTLIEKTFGKDVTTRTWDTVQKVAR